MKKALAGVTLLVVIGAGYFGYGHYQRQQFIERLLPHVKNASLRVENSARYETEDDSKITFKELFDKLEADIAEVDKRLIEVQTLASPDTAALSDPVVAYLKGTQVYLRAMLLKYRKGLAVSSASNWATQQIEDLRASSGYGVDYARRSADKALKDLTQAQSEYNETIPELRVAAEKLKELRAPLALFLPADALVTESQIEAVIAKNPLAADSSK